MAIFENTTPVPIPDNDPAGAYSDLLISSGDWPTSVTVSVTLSHTYISDLIVWLIAPTGLPYLLRDSEGGSASGTFITEHAIPELTGADPNGLWRIWAVDQYGGDSGSIERWSVKLAADTGLFARVGDVTGDFTLPLVVSGVWSSDVGATADLTGVVPAVGELSATLNATLDATGLAGIDLISTARPRELYRCYIESPSQGDIEIPVSAITMRQNAGGTGYVQVSMPQYSLAGALIARAGDGRLRVDSVLEKEGVEQATPFALTDAVNVTQERGARNRSITITGRFTLPATPAKSLPLDGPNYISDNGSTLRVRCQHNPRIAVGDTVYAEQLAEAVVQSTVLTIGQNGKQFELTV